jgi:hypothetical protein
MTAGRTLTRDEHAEHHTCELVEHHDIVMPLAGRDINVVIGQCRLAAEDWAESQGLAIVGAISSLSRADGTVGVTFDVFVGNGQIHSDQTMPGVLDTWTFSGRLDWWRDWLLERREDCKRTRRFPPSGDGATVTSIFRDDPRSLGEIKMGVEIDNGIARGPKTHWPRTDDGTDQLLGFRRGTDEIPDP